MGRTFDLVMPIPTADSVPAAIAGIRQRLDDELPALTVEIDDDGRMTARRSPYSGLVTPAHMTGRIIDPGPGPVLTAEIHKVATGTIWPFLMGIPAVVLAVCTLASWLFDGAWQPFAFVGLPGAAILGFLSWKLVRQQEEHFLLDVGYYMSELRTLLGGYDEDEDDA